METFPDCSYCGARHNEALLPPVISRTAKTTDHGRETGFSARSLRIGYRTKRTRIQWDFAPWSDLKGNESLNSSKEEIIDDDDEEFTTHCLTSWYQLTRQRSSWSCSQTDPRDMIMQESYEGRGMKNDVARRSLACPKLDYGRRGLTK